MRMFKISKENWGLNILLAIILMNVIVFMNLSTAVQAAAASKKTEISKSEQAKAAFLKFMEKKDYEKHLDAEYGDGKYYFTVIDLNQDGITELMVGTRETMGWQSIALYQFKNGKVVLADELYCFGSPLYNKDKKNLIYLPYRSSVREECIVVTKLEKGSLKTIRKFSYHDIGMDRDDNYIYEYSTSKGESQEKTIISKKEYDSYFDKYVNDAERIELYENTKQNRNLYLQGKNTVEVGVGQKIQLSLDVKFSDKVTWSSSNKSIVEVDKSGNIKPKKLGTATVTATVKYVKHKEKFSFKIKIKDDKYMSKVVYRQFLEEMEKKQIGSGYDTFAIFDINGDGVMELLHSDAKMTYYTYVKGEMKELTSTIEGGSFYNPKKSYLVLWESDGDIWYNVYKMKNNKLTHVTDILYAAYSSNGDYFIDKKKITKKEADKYLKGNDIHVSINTEEKRKQIIK